MGIEDRQWYRDANRKRLNEDYRYNPKLFRASPPTRPTTTKLGVLWRTVIYCLAIYGAMSLLQQVHHRYGKPGTPSTYYAPPVMAPTR